MNYLKQALKIIKGQEDSEIVEQYVERTRLIKELQEGAYLKKFSSIKRAITGLVKDLSKVSERLLYAYDDSPENVNYKYGEYIKSIAESMEAYSSELDTMKSDIQTFVKNYKEPPEWQETLETVEAPRAIQSVRFPEYASADGLTNYEGLKTWLSAKYGVGIPDDRELTHEKVKDIYRLLERIISTSPWEGEEESHESNLSVAQEWEPVFREALDMFEKQPRG